VEHITPHLFYYIPFVALLGITSLVCAAYSIVRHSSTAFRWHVAITVTLIVVSLLFSVVPNETGVSFEFGLLKTNRIAIIYFPVAIAYTCLTSAFSVFRYRSTWYSHREKAEGSILEGTLISSSNPYHPPAQ
jgi:hypothetical protein